MFSARSNGNCFAFTQNAPRQCNKRESAQVSRDRFATSELGRVFCLLLWSLDVATHLHRYFLLLAHPSVRSLNCITLVFQFQSQSQFRELSCPKLGPKRMSTKRKTREQGSLTQELECYFESVYYNSCLALPSQANPCGRPIWNCEPRT